MEFREVYAKEHLDDALDRVLKSMDLSMESCHLLSKDVARKFRQQLERELSRCKFDLSFTKVVTDRYHVTAAGNVGAIAWDYYLFLWDSFWKEQKMTKEELITYLDKNPDVKVFEETVNYLREIPRSQVVGTSNTYTHMGIGSCASTIEHKVSVSFDSIGNVRISKFALVWD